jgi:hypothetical protein
MEQMVVSLAVLVRLVKVIMGAARLITAITVGVVDQGVSAAASMEMADWVAQLLF